jgi:hypothetical protein
MSLKDGCREVCVCRGAWRCLTPAAPTPTPLLVCCGESVVTARHVALSESILHMQTAVELFAILARVLALCSPRLAHLWLVEGCLDVCMHAWPLAILVPSFFTVVVAAHFVFRALLATAASRTIIPCYLTQHPACFPQWQRCAHASCMLGLLCVSATFGVRCWHLATASAIACLPHTPL